MMNHPQSVKIDESLDSGLRSSRKKPNGIVIFDNEGVMWYREVHETKLKRAIWHDNIRDWLIEFTNKNGSYTHGREKGDLDNDVTSFHREHASWAYDINHRPEILFQFEPLEREDPGYEVGPWIHRGCVVLDADNHPVRNFKEIPLACSTKIEPWLQETLRRMHSKITANDFRARMLRDPTGQGLRDSGGNWTGSGKDPLLSAATYDFQMTRFRQKHRCISWVKRGGSPAFRNYLWSIMTPFMRQNNTTRGLGDVVDCGELAKMSMANKGKHLSRAGGRAISDNERKRRLAKEKARAARFDQKQAAGLTNISKQRKQRIARTTIRSSNLQVAPNAPTLSRTTSLREHPTHLSQNLADGHFENDNVGWQTEVYDERFEGRFGQHNNTQDEQCDEDKKESADSYDKTGDYNSRRSTRALIHSNKQGRIDDTLPKDKFNTFQSSASHIPQPVTWAVHFVPVSPGMADQLPEGTPDTAPESTTINGSVDPYDGLNSSHTTELEDGEEFLVLTPSTSAHKLLIHHLLEPSKEQYVHLTHQIPPESDSNQSYLWQYGALQGSLTRWWRTNGQGIARPILLGLLGCTSSQLTWNVQFPPQLSVDLTPLLDSVFRKDKIPGEAALGASSQEPETTWGDEIFNSYVQLDGPGGPVNSPSDEVVGYF